MSQSAVQRLGVADYGDTTSSVGNVLTYPRRIIIAVLKILFSQKDYFTRTDNADPAQQNPYLYVERDDGSLDASSRLVIGDQAITRGEANEARPRIIVDRMSGSFQNGRFTQQNGWTSGTRSFQDMFISDMTIRCVGRYKIESELLSVAVGMGLTMFNHDILHGSKLHEVGLPVTGPTLPERSDADTDQWATTLNLRTAQPIGWTLSTLESTVVNEICLLLQEVRD